MYLNILKSILNENITLFTAKMFTRITKVI